MTWVIIQMLIAGVGVGLISGALGLGGGVLMVPVFLTFIQDIDVYTAKGTSLFVIILVAFFNAIRHNRGRGFIPWRTAAMLALGAIAGSYAGGALTALLPEDVVIAIFMASLAALAIRTFLITPRHVAPEEVRQRGLLSVVIGLFAGLTGGATGTGGGTVLVPMSLMSGIASNYRVVGLSNMVMVAAGMAGALAALMENQQFDAPATIGHICFPLAIPVFIGAQIGSPLGIRLNARLTLRRRKIIFGILLGLISLRMLFRLLA
jgi:uncharacterized protein